MKKEIKFLEKEYLISFYDRFEVNITEGKKHFVWDDTGKKYLDFTSGIGVVSFGHSNKTINSAIKKQLDRISHISNLFYNELQIELAKKICEKSFKAKIFYCNSGAEANEAAIKVARIFGNSIKKGKNKILSLHNSFHGRTIATISLTGQDKYKVGFEPLLENIDFITPDNVEELEKKFDENVCAIFLEPVQGEGGVKKLSSEFVLKARELCSHYNALLVFDEVQTGIGKTGKYFGYQNFDITPDAITLAKSLGNGIPVGALVLKPEIAERMKAGLHASTFGGNFIACAAGIKVMELLNQDLLERINQLSTIFKNRLLSIQKLFPDIIEDVRVYGLMIGISLSKNLTVKNVINSLINKQILTLKAGENVLRLLPPFTIGEKEIDNFCNAFADTIRNY